VVCVVKQAAAACPEEPHRTARLHTTMRCAALRSASAASSASALPSAFRRGRRAMEPRITSPLGRTARSPSTNAVGADLPL
jgi:hypothetical protein